MTNPEFMALFTQVRDSALALTVERLAGHADALTIETAFNCGWQACLEFNRRADEHERHAHFKRRQELIDNTSKGEF